MDLTNMRQNGVRSVHVSCLDCHHKALLNVDSYPGHVRVKSFEGCMRCNECGSRRTDVRANWKEAQPGSSLTGVDLRKMNSGSRD
jgi:hypothetical protein